MEVVDILEGRIEPQQLRVGFMTITVQAMYENGVLRPLQPLPLKENEEVQITLETGRSRVDASFGLLGWKGGAETVERIALDPIDEI